eukprot:4660996-Pleurochrysis_carterae.AAC.4
MHLTPLARKGLVLNGGTCRVSDEMDSGRTAVRAVVATAPSARLSLEEDGIDDEGEEEAEEEDDEEGDA